MIAYNVEMININVCIGTHLITFYNLKINIEYTFSYKTCIK